MRNNKAMTIDIDSLQDNPVALKKLLSKVVARNNFLEEQFRLAQQKQFGSSSEAYPGQGQLFNEAEELAVDVAEPEKEAISNFCRV